jgi:polyhydroxybutyrate depolymerase
MAPSGKWVAAGMMGLVFLCGCLVSCAGAQERPTAKSMAPGTHPFAVTVKGVERRYLLHVPSVYDPARKWPVVVMFHGGGGTANIAMWETGWSEKADKEGFLAVFPEGTPPDASRPARFRDNPQTWNDGSRRTNVGAVERGVADVEFVTMMLADLKVRFSVDERRIYATGFSNGASMTFRVARELAPLIAALAPVAGGDWLEKQPERPVPLLYITGTADPLNPVAGGEIRIGRKAFGTKPGTQEMIDRWVRMVGSPGASRVIYEKDGATGIAYGLAGETAKVLLYTIDGHGHHWPGGKSALPERIVGKNTAKLKATDVIWEFFKAHSSPDKIDAQQDAPADAGKPRR